MGMDMACMLALSGHWSWYYMYLTVKSLYLQGRSPTATGIRTIHLKSLYCNSNILHCWNYTFLSSPSPLVSLLVAAMFVVLSVWQADFTMQLTCRHVGGFPTITGTKAFHLKSLQCNSKVALLYLLGIPQLQPNFEQRVESTVSSHCIFICCHRRNTRPFIWTVCNAVPRFYCLTLLELHNFFFPLRQWVIMKSWTGAPPNTHVPNGYENQTHGNP